MLAVRVKKTLDFPIESLPELNPLVGRYVEIIAIETALEETAPTVLPVATIPPPPPPAAEPQPLRQRVRVCGMVAGVSDGGDTFRLALDESQAVPCAWAGEGPSPAVGAAGRKMVVAGTGVFDSSGKLIRVDVRAGTQAMQADLRFARMPVFGELPDDDAELIPAYSDPIPLLGPVAPAPVPEQAPRPALSAKTSFRELFGVNATDETE